MGGDDEGWLEFSRSRKRGNDFSVWNFYWEGDFFFLRPGQGVRIGISEQCMSIFFKKGKKKEKVTKG